MWIKNVECEVWREGQEIGAIHLQVCVCKGGEVRTYIFFKH